MGDEWISEFRPAASLSMLEGRARLLQQLRRFFDLRGFLEVETPLLSADSVVDAQLDPLSVTLFDDARQPAIGRTMWLQTSPEFAMKRLLAAGATAIYQVTRAFRGGECGRWHNPEFTIVEWYRVGDGYGEGLRLLGELAQELLGLGPPERVSYAEAFQRWLQIDPHRATVAELAGAAASAKSAGEHAHRNADRDEWLNLLLAESIEPRLGVERPTILYDYPASQAALARVRSGPPPWTATDDLGSAALPSAPAAVAERFELYVQGVELANGYHELLDATALRARIHQQNQRREAAGRFRLPEESRLLAAMESGLPPCCGVALGFDRLAMVALGAQSLSEVIAFPIDRA